jgi:hypothetical protein
LASKKKLYLVGRKSIVVLHRTKYHKTKKGKKTQGMKIFSLDVSRLLKDVNSIANIYWNPNETYYVDENGTRLVDDDDENSEQDKNEKQRHLLVNTHISLESKWDHPNKENWKSIPLKDLTRPLEVLYFLYKGNSNQKDEENMHNDKIKDKDKDDLHVGQLLSDLFQQDGIIHVAVFVRSFTSCEDIKQSQVENCIGDIVPILSNNNQIVQDETQEPVELQHPKPQRLSQIGWVMTPPMRYDDDDDDFEDGDDDEDAHQHKRFKTPTGDDDDDEVKEEKSSDLDTQARLITEDGTQEPCN